MNKSKIVNTTKKVKLPKLTLAPGAHSLYVIPVELKNSNSTVNGKMHYKKLVSGPKCSKKKEKREEFDAKV